MLQTRMSGRLCAVTCLFDNVSALSGPHFFGFVENPPKMVCPAVGSHPTVFISNAFFAYKKHSLSDLYIILQQFFPVNVFFTVHASNATRYSSYRIPIIVSPCAGAVGPAASRFLAFRICGISSGFSRPMPTCSSVPAMIRTIL